MARLSSMPPGTLPGRHALTAIAAVLIATPSPAPAGQYGPMNSPPPSSAQGDRTLPQSTEPTALPEVYRAAACVVGRDPAAASEMLATAPYSREERQKATNLLRSAQRCIRERDAIVTSSVMLRGALAEALYEAQFAAPPAARSPAVPVAPGRIDASAPETAARIASAMALADCSAGTQPETVRTVLATEVEQRRGAGRLAGPGSGVQRLPAPGQLDGRRPRDAARAARRFALPLVGGPARRNRFGLGGGGAVAGGELSDRVLPGQAGSGRQTLAFTRLILIVRRWLRFPRARALRSGQASRSGEDAHVLARQTQHGGFGQRIVAFRAAHRDRPLRNVCLCSGIGAGRDGNATRFLIPWRIDRPTPTQREGTRVLYRFGNCTVEAKLEDSAQLLRMSPGKRGK